MKDRGKKTHSEIKRLVTVTSLVTALALKREERHTLKAALGAVLN